MKIKDLYLSSTRKTRVAIFCLILILASLLSYVNNVNPLITAGVLAGSFIFVEVLFSKPKLFWLTIFWGLAFILLGGFSVVVYLVFSQTFDESVAMFSAGLILLAGIPSMVLIGGFTWLTGYGSPLLNLITTQAIYLVTLGSTFGSLAETSLLLPLGVSFVVGFIYPLLNWWVGGKIAKRKSGLQTFDYPENKLTTLLSHEIENIYSQEENILPLENPFLIGNKTKKYYMFLPLAGDTVNSVLLDKNYLKVDGKDYTWVLDKVAEKARTYSRSAKIPQRNIVPVVVVPKISPAKKVTPIVVRNRFQPQKNLGTVLIITKDKLASL